MNNSATDTLSGSYGLASITMPDGTTQSVPARCVRKPNGTVTWIMLTEATLEAEARFANTAFAPHDHTAPTTAVLTPNARALETEKQIAYAHLLQFLGDPDRIIQQKGLDAERIAHMKKHPASLTMARSLCLLAGPKWREALTYIPKFYPGGA